MNFPIVKAYLDTEFNLESQELISMALWVNEDCYFYEVLEFKEANDWVKTNVVPKLDKDPITLSEFQQKLEKFIVQFRYPLVIIADWPDDIAWFCRSLITTPGKMIGVDGIRFQLLRIDAPSENPHNALADAKGIAKFIEAEYCKIT